jgi:hypothetical protein
MSQEAIQGEVVPEEEVSPTDEQREAFRLMYWRLFGVLQAVARMENRLKGMNLVAPTPRAFVDLVFQFNAEVDTYYRAAPQLFAVDLEMLRRLAQRGPDLGGEGATDTTDVGEVG